mgnify:CR=1 FL=1
MTESWESTRRVSPVRKHERGQRGDLCPLPTVRGLPRSSIHEVEAVNVLALDLGSKTGWALVESGRIESGVQVFDVKRGESPGMRYVRFRRWLGEQGLSFGNKVFVPRVELIVYEQVHHRGGAATEVASGFSTRVQEFCAEHGIEHAAIHSATLKKFATGKGNADKGEMFHAAVAKGWLSVADPATRDDNEVDALCLLRYALAEIIGP